MDLTPIIIVPMILFLIVVAPIWLTMHYRSKRQATESLSAGERDELERLLANAESMRERIETLESILDAQTPDWRQRHDASD